MTAHDADQVIGRIRNDGGWDRRYRRPAHSYLDELPPRPVRRPPPPSFMGVEIGTVDDAVEVIVGVIVFGTLFIGAPLLLWLMAGDVPR
ncbi:MAG: hypothetical protein IT341_10500 [Chloroflexi bacterium]|nr:hypothetical protein [Chloroflexota bacterium]